jgi:CBS domain-containing protein
MKIVEDILRVKGSNVYSTMPDANVYRALEQMAKKNVDALPVIEGEKLIGIV